MDKKITYGIIGLITILAGMGGYVVLSENEIDNAYYCTTNERVGIFEYLSSSNKTGYWFDGNIRRQSTCTHGEWIPLTQYCEMNNISNCGRINIDTDIEDEWTGKYWCQDYCEPIYVN